MNRRFNSLRRPRGDSNSGSHCASRACLAAAWLAATVAAGCGEDSGLVPVYGTVTIEGEKMPGPGDLTFVPTVVAEGFPRRPATAEFADDGRYRAQSFRPGDGLYPGTYQVSVACWAVPPTPDGPAAESHLAARFGSHARSGITIDVQPGSRPVQFDIDLTPAAVQ